MNLTALRLSPGPPIRRAPGTRGQTTRLLRTGYGAACCLCVLRAARSVHGQAPPRRKLLMRNCSFGFERSGRTLHLRSLGFFFDRPSFDSRTVVLRPVSRPALVLPRWIGPFCLADLSLRPGQKWMGPFCKSVAFPVRLVLLFLPRLQTPALVD